METAVGLQTGIELYAKKKWLAISTEFIIWKSIPAALLLTFFSWGMREFPSRPRATSFTLFRINILWLDWEVYFIGGDNNEKNMGV